MENQYSVTNHLDEFSQFMPYGTSETNQSGVVRINQVKKTHEFRPSEKLSRSRERQERKTVGNIYKRQQLLLEDTTVKPLQNIRNVQVLPKFPNQDIADLESKMSQSSSPEVPEQIAMTASSSKTRITDDKARKQTPRQVDYQHLENFFKMEKQRKRRLEERRQFKEMAEASQHPFTPQLLTPNNKKRSLTQIIGDLYPDPKREGLSQTREKQQDKTPQQRQLSASSSKNAEVFERLYKSGREQKQKKLEISVDNASKQERQMFSPNISGKAKQLQRKISPSYANYSKQQDSSPGLHLSLTPQKTQEHSRGNVFDCLSQDANRRRRGQEMKQEQLSATKTVKNLISQNSVKILYNKSMKDFDEALKNISSVYQIEVDSINELNEEQFVALLFSIGLFKNICHGEEKLYEDLLSQLCSQQQRLPVFTLRNLKVLVLAIQNIHQDWMEEEDVQGETQWDDLYHKRIQNYKLMKTKLKTANSDALRYSCQEGRLELPADIKELLTKEDQQAHLQMPCLSGVGTLKGRSLCLNEQDVVAVHRRFYKLYLNKLSKEQEIKDARHLEKETCIENSTPFHPKINTKSHIMAQKAKQRVNLSLLHKRRQDRHQKEHQSNGSPVEMPDISFGDNTTQMKELQDPELNQEYQEEPQQNKTAKVPRPINYNRLNQLYLMGKNKISQGIVQGVRIETREKEEQLAECTFQPQLSSKKSKTRLEQTVGASDMKARHKKTYSEINQMKKGLNKTLDNSGRETSIQGEGQEEEVLLVELQIGNGVKEQIEISVNDNANSVAQSFCKLHGKCLFYAFLLLTPLALTGLNDQQADKVAQILREILEKYYNRK